MDVAGGFRRAVVRSTTAIVVSLLVIFLALLAISNEIRYQGCVARQDQRELIGVTQNPQNPEPVLLECHRVPLI